MSQASFNGHAFIQGVTDGGDTVGVEGYGQVFIDSAAIQYTADFAEHRGAGGGYGALQWTGEKLELTLTFRPCSDQSEAVANAKAIIIPNGARVNLSGFRPIYFRSADILNASWLFVGPGSFSLNATDRGEAMLTLKNYLASQAKLLNVIPEA